MQDEYSSSDDLDMATLGSDTNTIELELTDTPGVGKRKSGGGRSAKGGSGMGSQDISNQAQVKTGEVIDKAQETAGNVVGQVRQQAESQLSSQKDRAADGLGSVAQTIRQTSEQLQGQDQWGIAQYVDQAAQKVEGLSNYLRGTDLNGIVIDVEHFARRQPVIFLAGAFTLGVIGVRFLKSSGQSAQAGSYSGVGSSMSSTGSAGRYSGGSYAGYSGMSYSGGSEGSGAGMDGGVDLYESNLGDTGNGGSGGEYSSGVEG